MVEAVIIGILLGMVVAFSGRAHAQTVAPIISEYGKGHAKGSFTVRNDSLTPLTVTLTPVSFNLDSTGATHYVRVPDGTHVNLAENAVRLGPKEAHSFDYDVRCDVLPCAVSLFTTFMGKHSEEGFAVAIRIPHTVYLCQKEKNCRANTRALMMGSGESK